MRATLTHQALRAWPPLPRCGAGEGGERGEPGEGLAGYRRSGYIFLKLAYCSRCRQATGRPPVRELTMVRGRSARAALGMLIAALLFVPSGLRAEEAGKTIKIGV